MTLDFLVRNWALVIASVLGVAIALFVMTRLYQDSAKGRLFQRAAEVRSAKQQAARAERRFADAALRLAQLKTREESVKPRVMSAAEEALQDAEMLKHIADDTVLRAQKKLRDVIVEDFPPNRQDELRKRYL